MRQAGTNFGALAMAALLQSDAQSASGRAVEVLHHPPKAKRVVQLFMAGGGSHIDLWDRKPVLERFHGQQSDFGEPVEAFQNGLGPWMKSPFKFAPYGKTGVHSQATYLQATGFQRPGAFLPASAQGTTNFPQRENPIDDLTAHADFITAAGDRDGLAVLERNDPASIGDRSQTRNGPPRWS